MLGLRWAGVRLGIRVQILILLGVLLAVAFVPLYFAVARLTEASLAAARRDAARDLGRAIAAHVLSAERGRDARATESLLAAQLSEGGVVAIGLYDASGARRAERGETALLPPRVLHGGEVAELVSVHGESGLLVVVPSAREDSAVAMVIALDPASLPQTPIVRLVALYTGTVALALLVFAYFAMTRLVVRPLEQLSHSAGRVAAGARKLEIPTPRARELAELAQAVSAMLEKLIADEQTLRDKIDELERATRELKSAQATVVRSERLASVGRLAAGVAHEIGNPIAALLGFEELLLSGDLPPEERDDFLRRMKKETERVNRVLRDLLDFARPKSGAASADTAEVLGISDAADVAETVELVASLVGPQKPMHSLSLTRELAPSLPRVTISGERLQQVLLNLVLNAADAAKSCVAVSAEAGQGTVVVRVDDDGPGVDPAIRATLFEPFVTTKEVGKGTGLGLAVCKALVEAAGGTLALVEGRLGGACFQLELPVFGAPVSSKRRAPAPPPSRG